jgi:hypothetical protein
MTTSSTTDPWDHLRDGFDASVAVAEWDEEPQRRAVSRRQRPIVHHPHEHDLRMPQRRHRLIHVVAV